MTANGWLQIAFYMVVLLGLAWPLGAYMARTLTLSRQRAHRNGLAWPRDEILCAAR